MPFLKLDFTLPLLPPSKIPRISDARVAAVTTLAPKRRAGNFGNDIENKLWGLKLDYKLGVGIFFGILLLVAIVFTLVNHRKKTKSNKTICVACRGMGFNFVYTSKPVPPCKKCNGTGYVNKQ